MKLAITLFACLGLVVGFSPTASATNCNFFYSESFEGDVGTSYSLSAVFDDGGFDYFGRYAVPDNTNDARDDFQLGWDLEYGIHGQDHDADGEDATQVITIDNLNINGLAAIEILGRFGALDSEENGFDNYEIADGDGIEIYATIDANPRQHIGSFKPPAVGVANTEAGDLYRDTNLDGFGDGTRLTTTLGSFAMFVVGTGNILKIEIECTSTDSFEPLAIDLIQVCADGTVQVEGTTWSRIKAIYR